ncbi:MAG: hypothetical protein HQM13_13325 [SAR324 cluster bacterium]|nr:hypothetical protein [SAR324 cluster bacterium]
MKGIVGPVDWDQQGNITVIALFVHGEKQYLISNDSKGKELFKYNGSSVKVNGYTQQDSKKKYTLFVEQYELL